MSSFSRERALARRRIPLKFKRLGNDLSNLLSWNDLNDFIKKQKLEFRSKLDEIIKSISINRNQIWSRENQYRALILQTLWLLKDFFRMDYAGIVIEWAELDVVYQIWWEKTLNWWELPIQIESAKLACDWTDQILYLCPSDSENWWVDAIFVFKDLLWNITWYLLLDDEDEIRELKLEEINQITQIFYWKIRWAFADIIWFLAKIDPMTWLYNRRWWLEEINKYMNTLKRENRGYSILALDIDFFKKVNDTYGHDVWDIVITKLAEVIKSIVKRPTDVSIRMWGEEFFVFLPETDLAWAVLLAEKIRNEFKEIEFPDWKWWIFKKTLSVWVYSWNATWVDNQKQIDQGFKMADEALYSSKNSWRDRVSVYGNA